MRSCVGGGDEVRLHEIYCTGIESGYNNGSTKRISYYFESTVSATKREKAMYRFINVITAMSLLDSYVEHDEFREFGSVDVKISIKTPRETVFRMVELVEVGVHNDMKRTRGAVDQQWCSLSRSICSDDEEGQELRQRSRNDSGRTCCALTVYIAH